MLDLTHTDTHTQTVERKSKIVDAEIFPVQRFDLQVGHLAFISLREEAVPVCQDVFDQILV